MASPLDLISDSSFHWAYEASSVSAGSRTRHQDVGVLTDTKVEGLLINLFTTADGRNRFLII
jgi:hypothetical protein